MTDDLDRILADYDPISDWANCATPDCPNKVCTWASRTLCAPCSESVIGKEIMDQLYNETHPCCCETLGVSECPQHGD